MKNKQVMAIFMAGIVCGCLCASSDSGGASQDHSLKGLRTTTTGATKADSDAAECLTNCDYGCKGVTDSCAKECQSGFEEECTRQAKSLITCQKACHSVTKTAAKAPNPRTDCLDKCAAAFEEGCDNDDFVSCQKGCPPEYQSCMRACYDEC